MAVFRVQKTQNYTIMSNHHLRNKALSLKAKGLLSLMLSLPEDWDYTTRGLASICKEGVDSVCATVRELEAAGYIIRRRIRDKNGQMRGMEYTVLEQPQPPEQDKPSCAQPKQAKPKREKPVQANPAQLNTKEQKKEITKNVSNPIRTADEREQYRDLIRENIEYDILAKNNPADRIRLDELVELMLDTVCSKRSSIRIAGDEFPAEVVKSRFLKLEAQHIQYVLDSLKDNPPHIRNIKKYLLAALYNAPLTAEFFPDEPDWEDESYNEYEGYPMDGHDLLQYADAVDEAVKKDIADFNGDLMQYYHEDDSVRSKVVSAVPSVEIHGNKLCGCLNVELKEALLDDEQTVLCNYISGQYSDGWGEGFEQRDIRVDDGTLAVHFWQEDGFKMTPSFEKIPKPEKNSLRPKMQLIGQDGNIFAIMGRASRLLKNSGQGDKAKEMRDRVMSCDSYQKALNIVSEYVETELSPTPAPKRDRGDAR